MQNPTCFSLYFIPPKKSKLFISLNVSLVLILLNIIAKKINKENN